MAVSLYRKYRPARFEDIIGQDHIARTLVNAIVQDRVSHAYLFTGPRGTGKTSTAKILAMALNCDAGKGEATPAPDGTCPHCEAIRKGSALDVVEMDAASNRGIDDIRDLRDNVHFSPVEGRMKVYIVDEVHMLTTEAFNALLKTLEEPPAHAIFVLATTEPHKVPATILSRCQRFDFRRPSVAEVVQVLSDVAAKENIAVEETSLLAIARAAAGSFRDALGILDQLAIYSGGKISLQETLDILRIVQHDLLFEAFDLVHDRDTKEALLFVERLSQGGTDYSQFIKDLLTHLRDLYVMKHTAETPASIAATEEQLERLSSQAAKAPTALILGFIDLLGDALRSIRQGSDPRLELELVLIKMTARWTGIREEDGAVFVRGEPVATSVAGAAASQAEVATSPAEPVVSPAEPVAVPSAEAVASPEPVAAPQAETTTPPAEKVSDQDGAPSSPRADETETEAVTSEAPASEASVPGKPAPEAAVPGTPPSPPEPGKIHADIDHLRRAWPVVLEAVKKRQTSLAAVLGEGRPDSLDEGELVVKFPAGYGFQANQIGYGENPKVIREALREITGRDLKILARLDTEISGPPAAPKEDARILTNDELIRALKQVFDAEVIDEGPSHQ